jgi:hypothetical protein
MRGIFASVILAIVLAYSCRELLYSGARKNRHGEFGKLSHVFLDSNKYNTIYIGSSRAESHFDPSVIDSITGLNSYNIGMEGASMAFTMTVLRSYLAKSDTPRYVVINVEYVDVPREDSTIFRFPRYFPYLGNTELYNGLKKIDPRFAWFRWMPFYSLAYYNEKYVAVSLRGLTGYDGGQMQRYIDGYAPLEGTAEGLDMKYRIGPSAPSPGYYAMLDSIAAFCAEKKIYTVFASSPLLLQTGDYSILRSKWRQRKQITDIAEKYQVLFLDYTEDPISLRAWLFHDPHHLTREGSKQFSLKFASELRQYMVK